VLSLMFAVQVAYLAITSWLDERAEKEDRKKFDAAAMARCANRMKFERQCFPCFPVKCLSCCSGPNPFQALAPAVKHNFTAKHCTQFAASSRQLHAAESSDRQPVFCWCRAITKDREKAASRKGPVRRKSAATSKTGGGKGFS